MISMTSIKILDIRNKPACPKSSHFTGILINQNKNKKYPPKWDRCPNEYWITEKNDILQF